MRYNTKLSIKENKRKLFVSLSTLIFVLTCPLFLEFKRSPETSPFSKKDLQKKESLQRAISLINSQPDSAEFLAKQILANYHTLSYDVYKIRALLILGKLDHLKGNPDAALKNYNEAVFIARALNAEKEECEALLAIGEIVYKKGEYDKALTFFLKADTLATQNKLTKLESYSLYYIGKYYQTTGNFSNAKKFYLRSLDICRKNKDNRQLALVLPSLGKYYISEGKLNMALTCYQEAFHISGSLNDPLLSADICNHLGGLYIELKEYDKAMLYHRKALQYRLDKKYPGELAKSYNNIGKIHLGLGNLDSAQHYFYQSFVLCKKINYKKGLVKSQVNLGETYRYKNELKIASTYLLEALEIAKKSGYDNGIAESNTDLGDLLVTSGNLDSAISCFNTALGILSKTSYYEDLFRVYKGLYTCYNKKQDLKRALAYHVLLFETEKKLLDVENKRQLAILNITFDTERKESEYQVILKDNALKASLLKSKNTFLWLIIVALGFTILLCLYLYNRFYIKKRANKKLEELNLTITNRNLEFKKLNKELETANKEKDKLFSIIAHELRNPLYWLQNLAEVLSQKHQSMSQEKIKKTLVSMDESAKNVYHLMDNLLNWSRSKLNRIHPKKSRHNLSHLISEATRMYATIIEQKEIQFLINVPVNIYINADADLFACVIRNLVSNAIKYTPPGGKIGISHKISHHYVTLIVSDSGKGMTSQELKSLFTPGDSISMPGLMQEKGSGLGLKLCKDFVEMNNGKIWAESIQGIGTCFFFTTLLQKPFQIHMKELEIVENMN